MNENKLCVSLLNVKRENRTKITNQLIENGVTWVHYDVMDKIFVPNEALSVEEVEENIKNSKKHFVDIHLMVSSPENWIEKYKKLADSITFHFEAEDYEKCKEVIEQYRTKDLKIGLAIKPKTNIEQIYEFLPYLDSILIMSVEPGKGGQSFIDKSLEKISKLRKYIDYRSLNVYIQVDGGINNLTGPKCLKNGAKALVSGTYLTTNPTKENVKNILKVK